MKTEDELDADIANLFDEVTITKFETVNGKPRVTDEQTIAQMEREEDARRMEEACGMFLTAERKFQKLSAHPDVVTEPKLNIAWWDPLDDVYRKERTVWRLFVGPQPDMRSNRLYARFREFLLKNKK